MYNSNKIKHQWYEFTNKKTGEVRLVKSIDLEHAKQFIPWEADEYRLSITLEKPE